MTVGAVFWRSPSPFAPRCLRGRGMPTVTLACCAAAAGRWRGDERPRQAQLEVPGYCWYSGACQVDLRTRPTALPDRAQRGPEEHAVGLRFLEDMKDVANRRARWPFADYGSAVAPTGPRELAEQELGKAWTEVEAHAKAHHVGIAECERREEERRQSSADSLASTAAELATLKTELATATKQVSKADLTAKISAGAAVLSGVVVIAAAIIAASP